MQPAAASPRARIVRRAVHGVLLLDKESVDVLVRFDLEGRYLMHCHKLEHEDAGMMLDFLVT